MRSMILALVCAVAVACGHVLANFVARGGGVELAFLLGLAGICVTAGLIQCVRSSRDGAGSRGCVAVLAGLLACAGLLRGAGVGPPEPARVAERGPESGRLRVFEVAGASEPGPRCTIALRGPSGPPIRARAPIETCPRSRGERVAVLAQTLRPHWRDALAQNREEIVRDLGRGPVMWTRPAGDRPRWQRSIDGYWRAVANLRQRAWTASRGDDSTALVMAAGLGLRSALRPERRAELRSAGLGHLIAVSGLHVAIAALWLQALIHRGASVPGISPARSTVIAWLPVWAYVGLTGGAASAIRAAAMLTFVDLGTVVGRPTHGPTSLAMVAAAMLFWRPQWLLDPGFALSVAAMAAIVTAPRNLGLLATSWRITWATAPICVLAFDAAPLHGLIGNALALPLFGVMMPAALVAGVVPGPIGELALALARLLATPILDIAALLGRLPAVGAEGLLAGAVLGLILRRAGTRRESDADRPRPWLPPKLACVLAVVIAAFVILDDLRPRRSIAAPSFDWIAIGTVRSRSLLIADPSTPGSACLHRPTGGRATWLWLLEQHGVTRLSRLDASLPSAGQPARSDPRSRALARQLERGGIAIEPGDGCPAPEPSAVREALRTCQFLAGDRRPALARVRADTLDCRLEGRWTTAHSSSH